MEKYEINENTMAIIGLDINNSKVLEEGKEYLVNDNAYEVMERSCQYYGSSYQGRVKGTINMTGFRYKSPIIVEESNELIFFPITTPDNPQCVWINLKYFDKVKEINNDSYIFFKNQKKLRTNISKYSITSQVLRSSKLHLLLTTRKNRKNN